MNITQSLQVVTDVCGGHLCNRQDRVTIDAALQVLHMTCLAHDQSKAAEKPVEVKPPEEVKKSVEVDKKEE